MELSILVKTLNEEHKLEACLNSVFAAIQEWGGEAEVIVADSRSTDATVAVAKTFPVKVVVLAPPEPRGCGVGVQLGYQQACGQFVLLLDGDMQLELGFLKAAIATLKEAQDLGGVAGLLADTTERNRFDRHRIKTRPSARAGRQQWLSGGGLYRKTAIEGAGGYAGNQNLLAFEEADLGLRLRAHGWHLIRLPIAYVLHTGHAHSTMAVIRRMWVSGRLAASGVLLKSAFGERWVWQVLRMLAHPIAVTLAWLLFATLAIVAWPSGPIALVVLGILAMVLFAVRKRSMADALFSVLLWHLSAGGVLMGLFTSLVPPTRHIECIVLQDEA